MESRKSVLNSDFNDFLIDVGRHGLPSARVAGTATPCGPIAIRPAARNHAPAHEARHRAIGLRPVTRQLREIFPGVRIGRPEPTQSHGRHFGLPRHFGQDLEGAHRASSFPCSKPSHDAAANSGAKVSAHHDLGSLSCG